MSEAEALGGSVRDMLGLSDVEPMYDIALKAASLGLLMFARDLGPDTADAATVLLRRGGISVINSHNMVGRRRLAAGHELGHYVVADEYTVDWRVAAQGGDIEPRLDRFARALLLPRKAAEESWDRWSRQFDLRDTAVQMASHYRLDMATLAKRLLELGILTGEAASQVRSVRTTREDIERFGLKVQEELQGNFTPTPFQNAVLKALVDEQISRERAIELLQGTFTGDQLPERRQRRADEIWKFVS